MLFNHVMRCYWFAELFAKQEQAKADRELMFLSAVLHDLGFTEYGRLKDFVAVGSRRYDTVFYALDLREHRGTAPR